MGIPSGYIINGIFTEIEGVRLHPERCSIASFIIIWARRPPF